MYWRCCVSFPPITTGYIADLSWKSGVGAIEKLDRLRSTMAVNVLSCAGLHVSVFIDHHQARLWMVFYKCWLHIGIPLCLQLCQCVYLLYKYIKVGGLNSEWYKNYTWMLGKLLRTSDCFSSGVFGVLVDLKLGGLRSVAQVEQTHSITQYDNRTAPQHHLHGRPTLPRKLRVKSVTKVKTANKYNYEHHDQTSSTESPNSWKRIQHKNYHK